MKTVFEKTVYCVYTANDHFQYVKWRCVSLGNCIRKAKGTNKVPDLATTFELIFASLLRFWFISQSFLNTLHQQQQEYLPEKNYIFASSKKKTGKKYN